MARSLIGESVLHYRVAGELGRGGMGVVYRAFDTKLERPVAIKALPPELVAENPVRRERFLREARAASALNHPNIVTVHDIITVDGIDMMVMEFVEGETLFRLMARGRIATERIIEYCEQIAAALQKAHGAGIIHRDLKPGNVMINNDGQVKILDFGLAKLTEGAQAVDASGETKTVAEPLTRFGEVVGTLSYTAPEALLGRPVDARADVFSFGVMLYEMIAGRKPFDQASVPALIHSIVYEPARRLGFRAPGPNRELESIALTCMAKEPKDRYASMSAVQADLRTVKSGGRLARVASGRPARAGRKRAIAAAVAVLVLAAAGGVAVYRARTTARGADPMLTASTAELQKLARGWLDKSYVKGNVERAIEALGKIAAAEPDNAVARAMLAEAYWRKNNDSPDPAYLQLMRENGSRAVELNPELAAGHVYYGAYFLSAGKPDEALRQFQDAEEKDPLSPLPWMFRGQVAMARKNTGDAESAFRKAVELAPDFWSAHINLGSYLYRNGRQGEAAQEFERASRLVPDNPSVYYNLAAAYHHLDRDDEAASALQRALEIRPTAGAFTNLGTIYFYQGKYTEAVNVFDKAIRSGANSYLHWGNYADACRWSAADKPKAEAAYRHAIDLAREELNRRPSDLELQATIAGYLAKSGQTAQALQEAGAVEQQQPKTGAIRFLLAQAYEIAGKRDRALSNLKAALADGYSRKEIERDPELIALRRDADYHRMLLTVEK